MKMTDAVKLVSLLEDITKQDAKFAAEQVFAEAQTDWTPAWPIEEVKDGVLVPKFLNDKKTLVEPHDFVSLVALPMNRPGQRQAYFGAALVRESSNTATYVASVVLTTEPSKIKVDLSRNAPPSDHKQFTCEECERDIKFVPLASTVAKQKAKQQADPTYKPYKMTLCPKCEAVRNERTKQNSGAISGEVVVEPTAEAQANGASL